MPERPRDGRRFARRYSRSGPHGRPIVVRDDVTVKGQVILYSEQRVGGNITDSSALKAIKTAAA